MVLTATAANGVVVSSGTSLTASVSATGFWTHTYIYDWSITKSMTPSSLEIDRGQTGQAQVFIVATRQGTEFETTGTQGTVTVTNSGGQTTQNLQIVITVQYKTGSVQFQDLTTASTVLSPAQLAPSETATYPFEIQFTPIQGAIYRVTAEVTITNHSGHIGVAFGPEPKTDFALPATPTLVFVDESAQVTDVALCPTGFNYVASSIGPWTLTSTQTLQYTVDITNVNAEYSQTYQLTNTATIVEADTQQTNSATAILSIYSGDYHSDVAPLTIGYWKNHAGGSGKNADVVSPLLPLWLGTPNGAKSLHVTSAAQAVQVLEMKTYGSASNGITKLYAQLLAAKLNQANGADTTSIAKTISQADAFLASNNWQDWNSLNAQTKTTVLGWMTTLDNFNNGLLS